MDSREALYVGVDSDGGVLKRPMSPHLDVYRFRLSMALSIANRISGVLSAGGFGLAVMWLGALASGPKSFGRARCLSHSLAGRAVTAGWLVATVYHLVGGVRHLIWDDVHRFEKSEINRDGRTSLIVTGGISAVLTGALCVLGGARARKARRTALKTAK
ncbi:succinate dehydrogenase, cytochrome b556 subunit [Acidomonas methanolica]|uniref:Succinate dehydrogenase cytochrome b556 subunit n=1 Tax=Acidomonas methanolica NBRC 104435 TaxID=1231351 RepID=A0A023D8Q3_ACIMT|nr:succinate dehydrogenase, cytochrome b556 subunit [Acidomonas methanolica]TCS25178.1 succinate dehydrogenase subunit C [Acidomonas methanolica]GAJ30115.1 succinate dehydrogenase cytochrome b subunit [Acidomonas methanolica NBRC 104435]GEK99673.1 hypothetical protein AME01nite_21720 [Acidomonas methanolica NBRC 104435]